MVYGKLWHFHCEPNESLIFSYIRVYCEKTSYLLSWYLFLPNCAYFLSYIVKPGPYQLVFFIWTLLVKLFPCNAASIECSDDVEELVSIYHWQVCKVKPLIELFAFTRIYVLNFPEIPININSYLNVPLAKFDLFKPLHCAFPFLIYVFLLSLTKHFNTNFHTLFK